MSSGATDSGLAPNGASPNDNAKDDERYMQLALALGRRGLGNTWPNPAVGAVIVKDEVIVGRGWTQPGGRPHAEVEALRRAKKDARGATLYVTLEPCSHQGKSPPCTDAVVRAGIARVVSALEDPNPEVAGQGHALLRSKGIEVEVGLGAEEARRAHAGHIARVTLQRPHVTLKLAISADGKVAGAGRKRIAITGEDVQSRVFRMRAQNDAILVGIGTVLADNPQLTCRLPGMEVRSPVRVILDARLRTPMATPVISTARETATWVFASHNASPVAQEILEQKNVRVFRVADMQDRLDIDEVLKVLAGEGITRLMVEGGPAVAAAFAAADLVDKAALFYSEKKIDEDGIAPLEDMPIARLTERLSAHRTEQVGADRLESYERR